MRYIMQRMLWLPGLKNVSFGGHSLSTFAPVYHKCLSRWTGCPHRSAISYISMPLVSPISILVHQFLKTSGLNVQRQKNLFDPL